ncbi:type I 3-dehydroquinate dehydratase [Verrucomicrobiaceae bacterium R5-34]|uniref:3-dehydroquinate dehydratase n=1 Tax=Oceaniferula flava TaxID=2800421 RepID=A0AAE2VD35_9BACT|nr:type I 3-dehydroquinate dehydratase [Oceaniferula flavus]MBK1831594.1 type I 3-dehydroquinate dehydratase [Verrucomicrobiaceae bacterium R5-34]MBK1854069.1 type I 3-dehydroquinate dehydratase [Oceaniferula flavus]MBM1135375.1 type I 3-dehydroquinate dehydratase [Oceaniferula flavus]
MSARQVTIPDQPLVVGSVASLNHLACLQPIELPEQCDLLEVRLDAMVGHEEALMIELDRFKNFPLLFTARAVSEGGLVALSAEERSELLLSVADRATWIDVELASYDSMRDAIHEIRLKEVGLILSYHNFEETPEEYSLQRTVELAEEADIVKLAVMHREVDDFARCTRVLRRNDHPMSLMGMGPLGAVSRLLYAQHGSLLNYGYLGDTPTAPGQWPAKMLKQAIAALEPIVRV